MNSKTKDLVQTLLIALFVFGFAFWCWFKPNSEYSNTERRTLDKLPELTLSSVSEGAFMDSFEGYATDQFPLRDTFRTIKAFSAYYFYNFLDNNDVYIYGDVIGKTEYPMKEEQLISASNKFNYIYNTYMKDKNTNVYLSIIPDKNAFIAKESGHLSMDYKEAVDVVKNNTRFASYIDIYDLLSIDDYYNTDTHWRQEKIIDVSERLAESMGTTLISDYKENVLDHDFYGVYFGQAALPIKPDTLKYLTNDIMDDCTVYTFDSKGELVESGVYNMEKAFGNDPYEIFLHGSQSIIKINNTNATTEKELVIFRDSFGSSLTPLLISGYRSITVIDIRYVSSLQLGIFMNQGMIDTFDNKDVLFIYSTLVLNNSGQLK